MKKSWCIGLLIALSACGYQKKDKKESASIGSEDATGDQVTAVGLALPDRNSLVPEVGDIFGKMNAYALRVWPTDPACPKGSRLDQVGTYPELNQIDLTLVKGCDYEAVVDIGFDDGQPVQEPEKPEETKHATYAADIKPILDTNCISCHSPNGSKPKVDLTSYATVKDLATKVVDRVLAGTMPPSGTLSDTAKELFTAWRNDGFPAGAITAPVDNKPKNVVTFVGDIKPLVDTYCIGCHSAGGKRPSSDLTTYEGVQKFQAGVVAKVLDGSMPKGNGPLSIGVRQIFQQWKDDGFVKEKNGLTLTLGQAQLKDVFYRTSATFWINKDAIAEVKNTVSYPDFRLQSGGEAAGLRTRILVTNPTPTDKATVRVTYQNKIADVLKGYCVGCHGKGGIRASSDLSTYNNVIPYRAQVVDQVLKGAMPKGGTLTREDKGSFELWGDQGYPEF